MSRWREIMKTRGKKMNNTKEISEMKLAVWKDNHYQEYREILSYSAQERAERRRRGWRRKRRVRNNMITQINKIRHDKRI